jgi:hypothetical protein
MESGLNLVSTPGDEKFAPAIFIRVLATYGILKLNEILTEPYSNQGASIDTYNPPPKELPGFPGSTKVKPKSGRARWRLPDGNIGEWDSQHGEVEVYDKTGKDHKGAYDPKTGKKKKDGHPKRKTEPE